MILPSIQTIIGKARTEGRKALLETEGLDILDCLHILTPKRRTFATAKLALAENFPLFPGARAVVKVVSHEILHKSDLGGVVIVPNDKEAIIGAIQDMEARIGCAYAVTGYSVSEYVDYVPELGNELLLGIQFTADFGPVVTLSVGGIYTEFLASTFKEGKELAVLSPLLDNSKLSDTLTRLAPVQLLTESRRGKVSRLALEALATTVNAMLEFARNFCPSEFGEFEVNPLVVSKDGRLIALDALATLTDPEKSAAKFDRPTYKIKNLLEPRSAAIVGVSEKMNPGRIILKNLLKEGFDPTRLYVVKSGLDTIDGCRCVPAVADLPECVDLAVLAVSAQQVPQAIADFITFQKAESLIVIPGGLEEKAGTSDIVQQMHTALDQARASQWRGPVLNGGNCLGIRSIPGKYNTLFLPEHKLPLSRDRYSPIALISQSGAFAVSRISKLGAINPKYAISIGNQMDLTVGDYLEYLSHDEEIRVFAVYVEGFKPLDGLKFLHAAANITQSGRKVILYRAGRTAEGAKASASHTASIAGNYPVTRELCQNAGVIVSDSIADFEDLTKLYLFLRAKKPNAPTMRLGAISNAGFECVAFADNLNGFVLNPFEGDSVGALERAFEKAGISKIVDVHNPIDLTPMAGDDAYEAVSRTVLSDASIDAAVLACVPLTGALNTLAKSPTVHHEDLSAPTSVVARFIRLKDVFKTPWVAVVDAGELYDPMAYELERNEIPTFRTADRALRLFAKFCKNP